MTVERDFVGRRGYDPRDFELAPMGGPVVEHFPVIIMPGFAPTDVDGDGPDKRWDKKLSPGQDPADGYRPRWGGGFFAKRGKHLHAAVDIMAAEGALVVAMGLWKIPETIRIGRNVRDGAGVSTKGGAHFYARDDRGYEWYGAHLSWLSPQVVPGAVLVSGTPIGCVGRTGNASRVYGDGSRRGSPHLHLRLGYVLQSGRIRKYDPVPLLRPLYDAGAWRGVV